MASRSTWCGQSGRLSAAGRTAPPRGAIAPQLEAIRDGLRVFVDEHPQALRRCCTPAEFQMMPCSLHHDVDDWQASATWGTLTIEQVKWFWAEVRSMSAEERGKLLHFCTGVFALRHGASLMATTASSIASASPATTGLNLADGIRLQYAQAPAVRERGRAP